MSQYAVLHIQSFSAPYPGNFMRCINRLEKNSQKNNFKVIYLFPADAKSLDWITELSTSGKNVYFKDESIFKNIILLNNIIKNEKVNIIHTHFCSLKGLMELSFLKFLNAGLKIIVHHHNHYDISNGIVKESVRRVLLRSSNLHIGVGYSVTQSIIKAGISPNNALCIVNAIDFTRLDQYKNISLDELDIQPNSKTILMFGYDYFGKGIDMAVKALEEICSKRRVTLLLVMAKNKDIAIKEIKRTLGDIPKWIKILEPRDDIATYYRLADVYLSASRHEGLPYSLIEAPYCGCRIVISDIPGQNSLNIPYTIQYPVEDVAALKNALLEALYTNDHNKIQIREEAKEYVTRVYSLAEWEEKIWNVYHSLI